MIPKFLLLTQSMIGNFASEEWQKYGLPVFAPFKNVNRFLRGIRRFWIKYGLPLESIWYSKEWIGCANKCDIIIVHMNYLTMNLVKYINRLNRNARVVAWYWNIVDEFTLPKDVKGRCEFWSFDPEDCRKYGMNFNHQYYFKSLVKDSKDLKNEVFFCGSDVGRGEKLVELYNLLKNQNVNALFKIVRPKSDKIPADIISAPIPYGELLNYNMESKALLEIIRPGQTGATIRLMEALFLKKKFITDNEWVMKEPFYNEKNIFVLEKRNSDELREFLNSDYDHSVDVYIDSYDFSNWLTNFVK